VNSRRAGVLLVLCVLLYANSLGGSFHYDDFHSLVDNAHLRDGANIASFFVDPDMFSADPDKSMYRPLLLLTYSMNYAWGQYDTWSYHLVNIALHALASILVAALAGHLIGRDSAVWIAGLFFLLHPLATEPVNYISSRSESLAACFYLLVLLLHVRRHRLLGGHISYGAALLSKSVALSAPLTLWFLDRMRGRVSSLRAYGSYALIAVAYLFIVYQNRFLGDSLGVPVRTWSVQLWTQLKAPAYYIYTAFMPVRLNVQHQFYQSQGPFESAVWLGAALVLSLVFLAWRGRKTLPGWLLLWAGMVLSPTFIMPLNMLVNERRLYLPLAGLAWLLAWCWRRFPPSLVVMWALGIALASLTWQRSEVWHDDLSLWRDAVEKAPQMHAVQNNLGKALQEAGQWDEALAAYHKAVALDPRHGDAYNNAATIYHLRGEHQAADGHAGDARASFLMAVEWYGKALDVYPNYEEIHQNLAAAYVNLGAYKKAVDQYRHALSIDSTRGDAWSNFGQALYKDGRLDEAASAFLRAIELLPNQAEPYNNLGNIYVDKAAFATAINWYQQALERGPRQRDAVLENLVGAQRAVGQYDSARGLVEQRLQSGVDHATWWYQLGLVERAAGRSEAAARAFAAAIDADEGHSRAWAQWGEVLAEQGHYGQAAERFAAAIAIDEAYSRAWYGLGKTRRALGQRARALEALRHFLALWKRGDARAIEAEHWIKELERPQ